MPPQDTQYDETLVEYKNDAHAEVALSVNLYELNKDWPLPGQYEFSIPIVVAANSRGNMEYTASYGTGHIYIYDVHTLTLGDNEGVWVDINYDTPHFWFYGAWYTKVFITSNGFVTFDSRAYNDNGGKWTSPNPTSIPTNDDPNIIIAPFWRDLDPSKGGTIEYGTGLYNDFAIVWRNVPNKANSNTQTFALYFSTITCSEISYIAFIYGSITNDVPTSIGIEDQSGKQGETVASMSSGELVEFTDSTDNYYRITDIKVSMSKLTVDGVNDEEAIIWIQGWNDSRPGGVNVILEDPTEGKYDVPQIAKVAAFAIGTAGLLSGYGWVAVVGYLADAGLLAYELSPMPRGTTVEEAMESTQTAYVKSAARDENGLFNYDHACDVSISPLILWQIKEPGFHRLLINAEVTVEKPDGTTYTLTTDNIELKLIPTRTLSISASTGGTTNPAPGTYTYGYGESVTVTAYPDSGYEFSYWTLDGQIAGYDTEITVTMNSDHTLEAYFVEQVVNLVVKIPQAPEEGVEVWVDGDEYRAYANVPVSVTVSVGQHTVEVARSFVKEEWKPGWYYIYTFYKWSDGSEDNPRTINVTSDTTLTAHYLRSEYAILSEEPTMPAQ